MVEKGDPPFTIAWSKDGEAIAGPSPAAAGFGNTGITGPRHTQTPAGLRVTNIDAHSSTIVIERVSAAHSGNYTCMARNSVAEVLWTAELIVRGKVEPMIIRIMRNHTCKDGRDRTIIYIYVFLHRLLSPLCLILFLFFFFCTTANAPSYYISCRITSSCRALAGLGWWNVRWWLSSEWRKIFYFVCLISPYLNEPFERFFLTFNFEIYSMYFISKDRKYYFHAFEKSQFQVFFFFKYYLSASKQSNVSNRTSLRTCLRFVILLLLLSLVIAWSRINAAAAAAAAIAIGSNSNTNTRDKWVS